MKKSSILFILSVFLFANLASAQTEKYYAMYIYNFTKYMEWENTSGNDFVITVVNNKELVKYLQTVAASKKVGSRSMVVKSVGSSNEITPSQIIILGKSNKSELAVASLKASSQKALLISENTGDAKSGAGISFKMVSGKIGFDINKSSIVKNDVKVSDKLMALGTAVR